MSRADLENEWEQSLQYFRDRGGVLFLSYCRFWERHGFVQQSLAQLLARNGVPVRWYDGSGWRPYQPIVLDRTEKLRVKQLPQLPGRRISLLTDLEKKKKSAYLKRRIKKLGGNPLIWIQAGIDEGIAADLPYVDVFSVFDDPYRHSPVGDLCHKAKMIVCQNNTAANTLTSLHGGKTHVMRPPVDVTDRALEGTTEVFFPPGFPEKIMGYVGTFFSDGFDLRLFEEFIQAFPDWGFVLMGRTDPKGMEAVRRFQQYRNFHYFPWVPRDQIASVWKKIRLTLLFYRPNRTQDGAFPVKIVEGLRQGVPCIATAVPKTADLEGIFPRSAYKDELLRSVDRALEMTPGDLRGLYERFSQEMDPKTHLIKVAKWLQQK